MEKNNESMIAMAFIMERMNNLRISQLKSNSVKAEIGKIAQFTEFSNFSKHELLEFFKKVAIRKLEKVIEEISVAEFN